MLAIAQNPEPRGSATLVAYFLDPSYETNRNMCEATKRVLHRDQEAIQKTSGRTMSSIGAVCLSPMRSASITSERGGDVHAARHSVSDGH